MISVPRDPLRQRDNSPPKHEGRNMGCKTRPSARRDMTELWKFEYIQDSGELCDSGLSSRAGNSYSTILRPFIYLLPFVPFALRLLATSYGIYHVLLLTYIFCTLSHSPRRRSVTSLLEHDRARFSPLVRSVPVLSHRWSIYGPPSSMIGYV